MVERTRARQQPHIRPEGLQRLHPAAAEKAGEAAVEHAACIDDGHLRFQFV